MDTPKQNISQEKTILRVKLEDLASLLKKLVGHFISLDSDKGVVLLELQMTHRLSSLAGRIESFESLEGKGGDAFAFFLKNLTDIFQKIGESTQWGSKKSRQDDLTRALVLFTNIEETIKDLLPIVMSIDEKRKELNYETFSGLLQRFIDTIEEKRHTILQNLAK